MKKNMDMIVEMVDNWLYYKYGCHFMTDDGKLNIDTLLALSEKTQREDISNKLENNFLIVTSDASKNDEINFEWDEKNLFMYVPRDLQERIQFSIEYILCGFDKVQDAVADITKEFQINRKGLIIQAEKELINFENDFTDVSMQVIINNVNRVGEAIEQTKESIICVCNKVNDIPKDRKKRLFKTPDKEILKDVMRARVAIYDYVYASAIYAELNLKIGRRNAAILRMKDSIQFLKEMRDSDKFLRVEQWNEKKDLFWEEGIDEHIELLEEKLETIMMYNGRIEIKKI